MHDAVVRLRENISRVYLGNPAAVDRVVCCLLARGHLLIEDTPGVGKTVLATALARSVDCAFTRIQLTPDMLPGDVLGVEIYDKATGEFRFKRGPVFANIVLADEINRTPPRTQAALLEAMNEATVSIDGRVHALDPPFMVIATQNPYDAEGTYQLPENQLDRFLMRISLGYPTPADEVRVLELRPSNSPLHSLKPVLTKAEVVELQRRVDEIRTAPSLMQYVVAFAHQTRREPGLIHGLSPRGSLALLQAAKATAMLRGRDHVVTEDILDNVGPVCAHRVVARSGGSEELVRASLARLPAPV